jgi:tRNA nucleotidyltransferase/poly(A) polymerase
MMEKKELLTRVSRERIYTEWKKLISGKDAYRVLTEYREIIECIIPHVAGYKLFNESVFLSAEGDIRELSLFVTEPYGEANLRFEEAMRWLKTDAEHRESGASVLACLSRSVFDRISIRLLLAELKEKNAKKFIKLKILLGEAKEASLDILNRLLNDGVCYKTSDLKIDGNDLMRLGYKGREIGEKLDFLLDAVSNEKIENEREALISAVTKNN